MNDDLFGERLGASLREHTTGAPYATAPLGLGDVKDRARGIRRRRTVAGSAAAAVALVAAGPFAATTLAGDDGDPVPPATSPTPGLTLPAEVTLAKDAPRGPGTDGAWFLGNGELGSELPIPAGAQDGLTRLGDRWLVEYQVDGNRTLYSVALGDAAEPSAGARQAVAEADTYDLYQGVAVSDDADLAAFTTPEGELTLIGEDGRTRVVTTLPTPGTPVDLLGDAGCLDGGDCEVVVSYGDGSAPELVGGDGSRKVIDADAVAATAATADLVVTREAEPAPGENPCTTVRDRSTLEQVWRSCEVGVEGFSPDGTLAVVTDAYQSGSGAPRLGLADALTGRQVTWFVPDAQQGFVKDLVWTPDGELELSSFTHDDQTWRLHHVTRDGEVTQPVEPTRGDELEAPHVAVTRP